MFAQIFPHPLVVQRHRHLALLQQLPEELRKRFPVYSNSYFHFSGGKLMLEELLKEIVSMPPNSDTAGTRSLDSKHLF